MRHSISAILFLGFSLSVMAQSPAYVVHRQAIMVENQFQDLDKEIRFLAQGLRRDAFIVVQVMAAGKELTDFQRQVALQKALDRLEVANRKAAQMPPADERTMLVLQRLNERVAKAQDQGLSADIDGVRRDLLKGAGELQRYIFRDLEVLRKIRKIYGEIQGRNGTTIADFDDALGEALGAALGMLEVKVTE